MNNEINLYEILDARENRMLKQKEIINKYNSSLISFTLNIPGPIKTSSKYIDIFNAGFNCILDVLDKEQINFKEKIYLKTGSEGYISIEINPIELKKIMIDIEDNHILGRIFDIDVFDSNYSQINRGVLGMDLRKCLICDNDAIICSRNKNHTLEELIAEINNLYKLYFNK